MRKSHYGFTIVELLVVIVVIGILAAITIVSYTGISNKAIVASLQSDLKSAATTLKMYNIDNGSYPQNLDVDYCPVSPKDDKYCLNLSSDNTFSYSSAAPYSTFNLTASNSTASYEITENSSPTLLVVSATGGTVTDGGGYRTHTFTSNGPLLFTANINVEVSISGGGGGAGSEAMTFDYDGNYGANGGLSSINYGGITYTAAGGGGGQGGMSWDGPCPGANGTNGVTTPYALSGISGGGSAGGLKFSTGYCLGGSGGSGGKVIGVILATNGSTMSIVVGSGGAGGSSVEGGRVGNPGVAGVVTVRYSR